MRHLFPMTVSYNCFVELENDASIIAIKLIYLSGL